MSTTLCDKIKDPGTASPDRRNLILGVHAAAVRREKKFGLAHPNFPDHPQSKSTYKVTVPGTPGRHCLCEFSGKSSRTTRRNRSPDSAQG